MVQRAAPVFGRCVDLAAEIHGGVELDLLVELFLELMLVELFELIIDVLQFTFVLLHVGGVILYGYKDIDSAFERGCVRSDLLTEALETIAHQFLD